MYNILSIQNIQKYLKYLIQGMEVHNWGINIHWEKILKYLKYLFTCVCVQYIINSKYTKILETLDRESVMSEIRELLSMKQKDT